MATKQSKYELSIIADELIDQTQIDEITKKIRKYGKITRGDDEGVKHLAYPIRNHESGHYLYYEMETDTPEKLSSDLNITDSVIRYLLVRTVNR